MDRNLILKQISILDFCALDLHLYLNTHPNDAEAVNKYNEAIICADKLRAIYEKQYGPLCSYRSLSEASWLWKDNPWPWCKDFNFELI